MIPRLLAFMAVITFTGVPLGCGYHFIDASAPYGVATMVVVPFQENEPVGLSQSLARELAILLAQRGVSIRTSSTERSGRLQGVITSSHVSPAPTSSVDTSVPSYRLRITVKAHLTGPDGDSLWKKSYTLNDTFLSASGYSPETALVTESQRRKAMFRLGQEFSKRIVEDLALTSALSSSGDLQNASSK